MKKNLFSPVVKTRPLVAAVTVAMLSSLAVPAALAEQGNPRVNQLGYLPTGEKIALYKTSSNAALNWQLTQNGALVASGQTAPLGVDAASGDNLQKIDFAAVTAQGSNFVLVVGADSSYPFSIANTVFKAPFYDALKYFYHNRSGIEIQSQYTGGGNTSFASNSKWARPAGHLNQGANKGDMNVPCWSGTCNYSLNVTKGWYDAGDHGKYVVNGGISVWTLLNLYERGLYIKQNTDAVADGTLNIPESSNGVADILDEARWEMEFLLSMQVPQGEAKAGMAHHKMHDVGWTGFPMAPHEDPQQRALVPPSTAATLNLAATAAQCARIWKDIDAGFASSCLTAAERAWSAAQVNANDIYSGNYDNGGGGYGDKRVADDFYWAAAELYITTGDSKYLPTINNFVLDKTEFGWADTELLGLISLAVVPTSQTASLSNSARAKIATIADAHLATQNASGYAVPLSTLDFYWGSNSGVANKLILMGLAYDFTQNEKYATGVGLGLDYLYGRNTLSTSFVTGEGTKAAAQPHHRFWAGAINSNFPWAPPGALVGGPDSGLDDGTAANLLSACTSKPASCWVDNINAYSVNEITINWNAPLAWVLDFYNGYASHSTGQNSSSSASLASSSTSSAISSSSSVLSSSSLGSSFSSVSSSASSVVSSASSSTSGGASQCNWYGTLYPLCTTTQSGWGWENQQSCISLVTCSSQPAPYGPVGSAAINHAPVASFSVNGSVFAIMISQVQVDASASTDADGDTLSYHWDWGNGDTATGVTASNSYGSLGTKTITLTVDDGKGGVSTTSKQITVISDVISTSSSSLSSLPASASSSSALSSSSSSILSSSSSSSSSSSTSSSSSSSSMSASGNCTYLISNEWNQGFTAAIRISNSGSTAINGWTVSWAYTDGSKITNSWNANVTGGGSYSASNLGWNGSIQPGQSVEFGFQGTKGSSGSAQIPVLSGSACQ